MVNINGHICRELILSGFLNVKSNEMEKEIIKKTEDFVKNKIKGFDSGHDWWHIERVRGLAIYINSKEKIADPFILDITSLLHDIADSKFTADIENGYNDMAEYLNYIGLSDKAKHIIDVIKNISFSNKKPIGDLHDPLLMVIQDADRLDAMGAIGIARAFNYGGFKNNTIYDPDEKDSPSTIKHFYDKLLILKEGMNTETGRKMASERHEFMKSFLKEFYKEWKFAFKSSGQNRESQI